VPGLHLFLTSGLYLFKKRAEIAAPVSHARVHTLSTGLTSPALESAVLLPCVDYGKQYDKLCYGINQRQ